MFDKKVLYSIQAAILFLIIASPIMYKAVNAIFKPLFTVAVNGCPTTAGLFLHTVVFGLIVYLLMLLQK